MPTPREPSWSDARTGLAVIAALAGVAAVVFFMDEIRRAVEEGPALIVEAEEARSLLPGSTVWVAGKPIGRVIAVRFQPPGEERAGRVLIRSVLEHEGADAMRADARARIQHASLLGPMVLAIDPGTPALPPYDFSDTLRRVTPALDEEAAMALADSLGTVLRGMLPAVRRLDTLLTAGAGTLAALEDRPELFRRLEADFRRLDRLLAPGEGGGGSLGALARDTALAGRLARVRSRLRELSAADADPGGEGTRRLAEVLARLEGRLTAIETGLRRGDGSLGRFLHDDALARERAALRARLDSVVSELAAHPLRWLRLRIF